MEHSEDEISLLDIIQFFIDNKLHIAISTFACGALGLAYGLITPPKYEASMSLQMAVVANTPVEIEVFGFGSLCVMVEGRCALSSYVTGESPNTTGVCSPAKAVRWEETPQGRESRLNGILIDRYGSQENAAYPTLCKGRFDVAGDIYYAIEEPASLNTLELLPQLLEIGVSAIKIEGRQRSPAYVAQVTRVWRQAIDHCRNTSARYKVHPEWDLALRRVSEGQSQTLGAYHRPWK